MHRKERIVVIVQARTSSTRLPEKVLKDIAGKPMLGHVIQRLRKSQLIGEILIAVGKRKNTPILKLTQKYGVKCFVGSEEDVLDRYYMAARKFKADIIVRITSDCPLIDPEVVDKVIKKYIENKERIDYTSNTLKRSYPRGLDTEVFSFKVLEKTWKEAKRPYQREHVTSYIYEHPEIFRIVNVENNEDLSDMRWTVDKEKDLEFIREVYKRLYKGGKIFLMNDILRLLKKEPQLMEMNKNARKIIKNERIKHEENKNRE